MSLKWEGKGWGRQDECTEKARAHKCKWRAQEDRLNPVSVLPSSGVLLGEVLERLWPPVDPWADPANQRLLLPAFSLRCKFCSLFLKWEPHLRGPQGRPGESAMLFRASGCSWQPNPGKASTQTVAILVVDAEAHWSCSLKTSLLCKFTCLSNPPPTVLEPLPLSLVSKYGTQLHISPQSLPSCRLTKKHLWEQSQVGLSVGRVACMSGAWGLLHEYKDDLQMQLLQWACLQSCTECTLAEEETDRLRDGWPLP